MFVDYLYQQIKESLRPDQILSLMPQLTPEQLQEAIDYATGGKLLSGNRDQVEQAARIMFANALKEQLENPASMLRTKLIGQPKMAALLQDIYLESLYKALGIQTAKMDHPFVLGEESFNSVVGSKVQVLGEGGYGQVYKTDKGYAVKTFRKDDELEETTLLETAILHYLKHPNVIELIATQLKPIDKVAMPVANKTLVDVIMANNNRPWIFYQLFRGLAYCHSKYVWHRDLKPENVLVFGDDPTWPIVKLADFGLAIPYARPGKNYPTVVTRPWRAPEVLIQHGGYDETIDVWSLGIMLYSSITQRTFIPVDENDMFEKVLLWLGSPNAAFKQLLQNPRSTVPPSFQSFRGKKLRTLKVDDPLAMEVLDHSVTWPSERWSALKILQLKYFDPVRIEVDLQIPASPIIHKPCGELLLDEQQQFIPPTLKNTKFDPLKAMKLTITWIWRAALKLLRASYRTVMYTLNLFVLILNRDPLETKELQRYMVACLAIAERLFELAPNEYTDYIWLAAKSFTKKELELAIETILTKLDYNIIFPTCYEFVVEYTMDVEVNSEILKRVYFVAMLLMCGPYMSEFTQAQIAQIAIEENDLKVNCLAGKPKLYNSKIRNYLETFEPTEDVEEEYQKYFPK
jgi:serine/threonine protein kinase